TDALVQLLPHLPPEDVLSVGSFAEKLTWWSDGKSVRDSLRLPLPPSDVGPHGPTNLEPVLESIGRSATDTMPKQLLVLTDAETEIRDPDGLAELLKRKNIHMHLLAIGEGSALPALRRIISATGGTLVTELDPQKWTAAIEQLMRQASPELLSKEPVTVRFSGDLNSLPPRSVAPWNRTWIKPRATALAEAVAASEPLVMA